MAPIPSVSTERGTTITARAGQTTALTRPTTKPARRASAGLSMVKPSSNHASTHNDAAVRIVTTMLREIT